MRGGGWSTEALGLTMTLLPYLEHVRDRDCGYLSVNVPLDAGVELSLRVG
jgi:hypothetical protein